MDIKVEGMVLIAYFPIIKENFSIADNSTN